MTAAQLKALILDMDGVLWRSSQPIGDLPHIFERIRQHGWQVCMATNNSTNSPEQYQQRLQAFGVHIHPNQVVNSSQATLHYMKQAYPDGCPVFVVGGQALVDALEQEGYPQSAQNAQAVVVGLDRHVTYEKLSVATLLIRGGARFIATNPDRTFPTPEGLVPGAGAIVAALQAATDQEPEVMGKPAPKMYELALERMGVQLQETLVVGDRLETDIAGAQALGCPTGLVLSGVSTLQAARAWQPNPDWIAADLTTLLEEVWTSNP